MQQQFCAYCGKGSDKATDVIEYPRKLPYTGNQIVVLTRHSHPEHPFPYTEYTVWDGETYDPNKYGHFCTRRCAYNFANSAVIAGYRVIKEAS